MVSEVTRMLGGFLGRQRLNPVVACLVHRPLRVDLEPRLLGLGHLYLKVVEDCLEATPLHQHLLPLVDPV